MFLNTEVHVGIHHILSEIDASERRHEDPLHILEEIHLYLLGVDVINGGREGGEAGCWRAVAGQALDIKLVLHLTNIIRGEGWRLVPELFVNIGLN